MSSDDESTTGTSSDESEDINVTGLVATRARRGNAGNLYESLRAHLDDEDLQKELLAEDEIEDAEDYEGSDADGDDDNDALDSSSDDEDAGPPKDGEAEDLAGEKELLKAERAENNKKRKAQAAKLTVPAWNKPVKKVKLANEVTADDGSSSPIGPAKRKKKADRADGEAMPSRQSVRASAVANREVTQANLEESAQRARKQKATLQESAKRQRANARAELTLEQRLEKCKRIEKETAKELGRFEREEAERVRIREEALMAKRRRDLDGPIIKTVSTSGYYENGKLKIKRLLHGSQNVDDILQAQKAADELEDQQDVSVVESDQAPPAQQILSIATADNTLAEQDLQHNSSHDSTHIDEQAIERPHGEPAVVQPQTEHNEAQTESEPLLTTRNEPIVPDSMVHDGSTVQSQQHSVKNEPLDPASTPIVPLAETQTPQWAPGVESTSQRQHQTPAVLTPSATTNPSWPPGARAFQFAPITPLVPVAPAPVLKEQAQRSLVVLESFDSLDGASSRRSKTASSLEPTPVAQVLLPDSYPSFNDEQATYLKKIRKLKQELLVKPKCALTTWTGKYKDPKTGVVFADVAAYKMLQRMIAGGCSWNTMLECWVGPAYGQMGRPARGVPEGFDRPVESIEPKKEAGMV